MSTATNSSQRREGLDSRGPELGMALVLMLLATLVVTDSLRVGVDWAADGPRAGYFPFYIGLGLGTVGVMLALRQLWHWRDAPTSFASRDQLHRVWAVLWPMVVYVAGISPLGLYVPSVLLIAYFMRRHGGYGFTRCLALSVAIVVGLFMTFEWWFHSPLPKSPLAPWLGF